MKSVLKSFIRRYSPSWFVDYVRRKKRIRRLELIRQNTEQFDLSTFKEVLDNFGINKEGVLFVHSGSDYFSNIEGGPLSVLKTLIEYMKHGTLMMPAFPFEGMASEYLDENEFSVVKTPSKMGLLTELFRRTPNVERSFHPTHSVCALGSSAEYITKSHHESPYPFGDCSPFGRLIELDGQVLMIGVGLEVLTLVHSAEDELKDQFPQSVYFSKAKKVKALDRENNIKSYETFVHDPNISSTKDIVQFEDTLIQSDILSLIVAGGVEFRLLDAKLLHNFLVQKALAKETIYGRG